ncbi:MAG: aromatic amino acid transport family protein, partial [Patescibacteria group bacterium]
GIFGIPFVFAKAGFTVGLVFLIFTATITTLFNLMFGEIILRTKARHQLAGYAAIYVGPWAKRVVLWANILGIYGALLAYLIIVGDFLHNVTSNFFFFSRDQYSVAFFVIVAVLIYRGMRTVRWIEFFLTGVFIAIMAATFVVGMPHINLENLSTVNSTFWFLPYGVLLFALAGLTSLPIQRDIMRGQERHLRTSIVVAVGIVATLYLLFALTVVGISGDVTTPDALSGLLEFLGPRMVILGSLFGIFSITTSFLLLGTAMLEILHLDYRIKRVWSWLLAVAPPALLFMAGLRTFIDVIGLVGAVAIGIESAIYVVAYLRARRRGDRVPEYHVHVPAWLLYIIALLFIVGAFYELFLA